MSPAQERVYQRLRRHYEATGRMPDLADMARDLGIHYVTLRQHLEALARKGYITFESRGRGRSPHVDLPGARDAQFTAGYRAGWQAAMRSVQRSVKRREGRCLTSTSIGRSSRRSNRPAESSS